MMKKTGSQTPKRRQAGFTLIEMLIAVVISLVVVGAMVGLMANSLAAGSQTIKMSQLQQEMRTAMQLMSRDVRRASYNAWALQCFSNPDCSTDGSLAATPGLPGEITLNDANDCFIFELDRDHDGNSNENAPGGFRRVTINGRGVIQMYIGTADTTCTSTSNSWVAITDPNVINVSFFLACLEIDPDDDECDNEAPGGGDDPFLPPVLSYDELVDDNGGGLLTYQRVRKLQLVMTANLVDNTAVTKTLVDRIRVRNDRVFTVST